MSKINKIDNNYQKPLLTTKNTGYAAAGTVLLATTRAYNKSAKTHKFIGFLAGALTLLHIGVIKYQHFKYKKCNNFTLNPF